MEKGSEKGAEKVWECNDKENRWKEIKGKTEKGENRKACLDSLFWAVTSL